MAGTPGSPLRDVLRSVAGVWVGTYTHLSPTGGVLDRFPSRQETRVENDLWFERVIYRPAGPGTLVLDFRGRFTDDGDLVIADPTFEGRSRLVAEKFLLFPYRWRNEPDVEVVELVTLATADYRTRLWQRFTTGMLDRMTIVEEHRRPTETPAVWR
jgi:Domain of unknown function (DUF3598)